MLEVTELYYHPATAEKPILEKVSFEVTYGTPAIIAGASGTGKTSLVEVISGLANQQKGFIKFNRKNLNSRQRRWLCGVVFQFPERYFLGLNISQELKLGHRRISGEELQNVLAKVGLNKIDLKTAPEQLSGGQQRRLAFATQILRKPSILILDEPTAGLDWSVKEEIIELLKNIAKKQLLIVVTHEPELFKGLEVANYVLGNAQLHKISKSFV